MRSQHRTAFILFIAFVLATGWIGLAVDRQAGMDSTTMQTPGVLIWLVGPLVAAVVYWLVTKRFFLGLKPNLREGWPWWIVALIASPLITLIVLALGGVVGGIDFGALSVAGLAAAFAAALPANFVKNIFEEFIWRGVIVADLVKRKVGDWGIYLISGAVWGLWHIPYYLGIMKAETLHDILPVSPAVFALIAIVSILGMAIFYAELFRLAGSIWPAVIAHAMDNSFKDQILLGGHAVFTNATTQWLLSPAVGVVTTLLWGVFGLVLRSIRLRKENEQAGHEARPA